jgi:hypothetical protein
MSEILISYARLFGLSATNVSGVTRSPAIGAAPCTAALFGEDRTKIQKQK